MDRTTGTWLSYFRITIGVMWLFELLLGRWWKLGLTSGLHPGWLGAEGGAELAFLGERAIAEGTFPWAQWLLETVFLPHAAGWSLFVVGIELLIALSFIFGVFTRFFALWAVGLSLVILGLGTARVQPFFAMGHLVLLWSGGGALALDRALLGKLTGARSRIAAFLAWAVRLPLLPRRAVPLLASACLLLGLYHLFHLTQAELPRIQLAGLELAALFTLAGAGLLATERSERDPGLVPIELVRIFVGFKLLHEVFVRTEAGIDGLPGWASPEALAVPFEEIALHHAAPLGGIVEAVFLPHLATWAIVFAGLQTTAGILLLLGRYPRVGAALGIALTAPLVGLGFVRLAPFFLIYLVFLFGAGSGRLLSVDGLGGIRAPGTPTPLPLGRRGTAPLAAVAFVFLLLAALSGLETDGYRETMAGFSAFFLALPAVVLAVLGRFGDRRPDPIELLNTGGDARSSPASPSPAPTHTGGIRT